MSDKTEAPSPRKIAEARERGQIARSIELNTALGLVAAFWLLRSAAGNLTQALHSLMRDTFTHLPKGELSADAISALGTQTLWTTALAMGPFVFGMAAIGLVANLAQTGGLFTTGLLSPNLQRLNPVTGFRRLFSSQSLVELLKALIKVVLVGWVSYSTLRSQLPHLLNLGLMDLQGALIIVANLAFDLGSRAAMAYLVFAALDYIYQRRKWFNSLRMSKQEVIDEMKRTEGDPQLRGRIRQQQRRLARQRMMQRVPQANVVIVNPTHLAIALMYDRSRMSAPRVVAKGALKVAERIIEIARANGVPIVQNIPLARALYSGVQIDQEIPPALYQAVAEVLAFVFGLKQRSALRAQAPAPISR